eukprot:3276970-Alexandrium_andersonii.AAC.1
MSRSGVKATSTCLPPNEPEALQRGRIQGSPPPWRRPRAIQAAVQLGAHAGFRHLRRRRHVDTVLYVGAQVRLADIDQKGLASPAAAP